MNKYKQYYKSPIGTICIDANENAVTSIRLSELGEENPSPITNKTIVQLTEYFEGKRREFDIPIELTGTEFQLKVWNELKKIPYGETRSYADIAKAVGNSKACRAVGGANNKNPIMIIVPCHRVIGKNGSMVGYAGGIDIKVELLKLESCNK